MPYDKNNWNVGDKITKTKLDRSEAGIELAVAAAEATPALIEDGLGEVREQVQDELVQVNAARWGINTAAGSDARAKLIDILNWAPVNSRIVLPPNARILCAGQLDLSTRGLTLDLNGSTLIKGANSTLLRMAGSYSTPINVTAIDAGTVTTDEESKTATQLTLATAAPDDWRTGDIVKVFSDDPIPGRRLGSAGEESRLGEYLTVWSVSGSTVVLQGLLRESMTTAVRVSKLSGTGRIENGALDVLDSGLAAGWTTGMILASSMLLPTIRDLDIRRSTATSINFTGCYGWRVQGVDIGFGVDKSATPIYGYGICDNSSAQGQVSEYRARMVRHAFTDDTPRILAGSTNVAAYGRSYGSRISGDAISTTNTAWSTHSCSENQQFEDVTATDCMNFFGFRGRKHIVRGGQGRNLKNFAKFFAESSSDSDSWGHEINDVTVEGITDVAFTAALNPTSGTRETRPSYLNNVKLLDVKAGFADVRNAVIIGRNFHAELGAVVAADTPAFRLENAALELYGDTLTDFSKNTTGATQKTIQGSGASACRFKAHGEWRYKNTADHGGRSTLYTLAASSSVLDIERLLIDYTTTISGNMGASSQLDYAVDSSGVRSEILPLTASSLVQAAQNARISRTRRDMLILTSQSTSSLTMFPFAAGNLPGQKILVINGGSTPFTIANGATPKTEMLAGADLVLGVGKTTEFVWTGAIWKQVALTT